MRRPRTLPAVAALGAILTACQPGPQAQTQTPAAGRTDRAQGASAVESSTVESLQAPAHPAYRLVGVALTTPVEGGGPHPVLAWQPVVGASGYTVVVSTADDRPYWAWHGDGIEIPVGGLPRLDDAAAGPRVVHGMTWVVTAWDGDGHAVAISAPRSIGP